MEYPVRSGSFDRMVHRALRQSCAAKDIGRDACLLVQFVVDVEDELFYSRAPDFWTSQLDEMLGFRSKKQLIEARDRAVAAGWLHYESGGTRRPGRYFAMIPGEAMIESAPDDSQVSNQAAPISSAGGTNQAGISSAGNPNQKPISSATNTNPATISSARGTNATHKTSISSAGNPNQKPISSKNEAISSAGGTPPYPFSNPHTSLSNKESEREKKAQPSKAQPPVEAIDLELAQQFFGDLRKLDEHRKEPDFDSWAREFEQLRKAGKPIEQIREVMDFVAGHVKHWRARILSPPVFRTSWDQLAIECGAAKKAKSATCSVIPDLTDDDVIKPMQNRGGRLYGGRQLPSMAGANYDPDAYLKDPDHGTF